MSILSRIARRIARDSRKQIRLLQARRMGIAYIAPNFIYWPRLDSESVVIDAGSSYQADFSIAMMERYGAKSYAIDPTRKHQPALEKLVDKFNGQLVHLPIAIGAEDAVLTFHESVDNESGSLMSDHTNIKNDKTTSYSVRCVTLKSLVEELSEAPISFLKLDIEGAEYPLLENVTADDISFFDQIFIEFHHHAVSKYSQNDTRNIVKRISSFGYEKFSIDDHNYLFWKR